MLEDEEVKSRYGCFYEEFNCEGYGKWTTLVFLMTRLAAVTGVVFGNKTPYAQLGTFTVVNLLAFGWTVIIRPQKNILMLIGAIVTDFGAVVASGIFFKLCDAGLDEETVEIYGDAVFYMYLSVSGINILAGFVKSGYEFYLFLKFGKAGLESSPDTYALNKSTTNNNITTDAIKPSEMNNAINQNANYLTIDPDAPKKLEDNFLKENMGSAHSTPHSIREVTVVNNTGVHRSLEVVPQPDAKANLDKIKEIPEVIPTKK